MSSDACVDRNLGHLTLQSPIHEFLEVQTVPFLEAYNTSWAQWSVLLGCIPNIHQDLLNKWYVLKNNCWSNEWSAHCPSENYVHFISIVLDKTINYAKEMIHCPTLRYVLKFLCHGGERFLSHCSVSLLLVPKNLFLKKYFENFTHVQHIYIVSPTPLVSSLSLPNSWSFL